MKNKKIMFALLFTTLYVHSEHITHSDATYCFEFGYKEKVELILVKENNGLRIRTPEEKTMNIPCESGYTLSVDAEMGFMYGAGKDTILFSGGYAETAGGCCLGNGERITGLPSGIMQVSFPPSLFSWTKHQKNNLLQFKNSVIDASMKALIICKPGFDTTYNINFRAEITGECDCDFLEQRKKKY